MSSSSSNQHKTSKQQQQWIPKSSTTPKHQQWIPKSPPPTPHIILPNIPQTAQQIQETLSRSSITCTICFDMIRRSSPIWSCSSCFSIFHLPCIRNFAHITSPNWICPSCKTPQSTPSRNLTYSCFCGRKPDPPYQHGLTPHSCNNPCPRSLPCKHFCTLNCHPGPCPPCSAPISPLNCPCGKTTFDRCCSDRKSPFTCNQPCNRLLRCRRHTCERSCHAGACGFCEKLLITTCFCGKKKTEAAVCGSGVLVFACDEVCGRRLPCGNHLCGKTCHPGICGECELVPGNITTCYCGKTKLVEERSSCLDPIPVCSEVCGKRVSCKSHFCRKRCHEGGCPPCSEYVRQGCRCGSEVRFVECHQLFDASFVFICERSCGQKRDCGRHRCRDRCCGLSEGHPCFLTCRKWLRCGRHACQMSCHGGQCPPCSVDMECEQLCNSTATTTTCDSSPLLESEGKSPCQQLMDVVCDEECYASTIAVPRLGSFHFEKSLAMFNVFSDLLGRSDYSNWFMTVEGSLNSMVLRKAGIGSGFTKKRDDARKIGELWKKLFIRVARTPPLILGLKYGDDRRALVLRFGEDCVLVWSNDKKCMGVLSDPAMEASATRLIEYGSTSPGAVVVAEALASLTVGNVLGATPWRVVVATSVDSWGPDRSPLRSFRLEAGSTVESRVAIGIADGESVEETDKLEEF